MKRTENGALGYSSSGSALLDMLYKVASYRNKSLEEIKADYLKVLVEDKELAVKFAFYVGDIREGLGERRLFTIMLIQLLEMFPHEAIKFIQYVPEYNRWKTVLDVLGEIVVNRSTNIKPTVVMIIVDLISTQLKQDWSNKEQYKPISLLAKWMPSLTASNVGQRHLAGYLRKRLGYTQKGYRTLLHQLRQHLDVVELKTSTNEWADIMYEHVPSKANLKYSHAFMVHDSIRRSEFLEAVRNGKVKLNVKDLFPHEIVKRYISSWFYTSVEDESLEVMWKSLSDRCKIPEDFSCIAVCDGSGSMYTDYLGIGMYSSSVAHALSIYFSENLSGPFKNKVISFSERPQLIKLPDESSLIRRLNVLQKYDEVANTDIEAVFDLILQTAVKNKLPQSDLPKSVLILSDMEFDMATSRAYRIDDTTLFEHIGAKYLKHGYALPKLIFWNLGGRTDTIPMVKSTNGVTLLSGFSTNLMQMVLSNELDPYKNLTQILRGERYKPITFLK